MLLPVHEFVKPATLVEGLAALKAASDEVKLIGGGTDVVFNMRGRLFQPDVLLSVKDLPELQFVEELQDGSVRMGAGCRLTDLERHPLVARFSGLAAGFRAVASRHIRNMATLGGNLCLDTRCWYANQTAEWRDAKGPCLKTGVNVCFAIKTSETCVALNASDTAPALIALDAVVTLANADGERTVPLAEFYTDDGIAHTVRRPNEIMTSVTVPPASAPMVYIKETARKGNDFAYGTIGARGPATDAGNTGETRLVLGSLMTRPTSLDKPARIIDEQGLTVGAIDAAVAATRDELGALTNLYTPAAYKSHLARSLVRRALMELKERL
jgi:4-hydroxybenzoyl-CoA reductase subunit beta